jgi:DNA end-binding protein Ku
MYMAAGRAIWTGSISFGLVNIPVRLYTAISPHDIGFHQFQAKTGQRIHYKRIAERSGREVPYEQIVKGYELAKGKIVLIEPEELETLEPKKTRAIEIEEFVNLDEIDPMIWDQTYYVGPDQGAGAAKSYEVLRRAMEDMGKVGVGRFVMRTKEYLTTVRPLGPGLVLETMFYADEIRDQEEASHLPKKPTVSARELALAKQLIGALETKWDLNKFEDTYRDRVRALIEKKARGEEIVREEEAEPEGQVIDLMEALKASLGGAGEKKGARAANGHRARSNGQRPREKTRRSSSRKRASARS